MDPGGDVMAGELEVLYRAPRADPGRRVQAQGLVDRHVQPRQRRHELGCSEPAVGSDGAVQLGQQPLELGGRAGQLVEQEGDRRGRGVVAGEEQRHHLVAGPARR